MNSGNIDIQFTITLHESNVSFTRKKSRALKILTSKKVNKHDAYSLIKK